MLHENSEAQHLTVTKEIHTSQSNIPPPPPPWYPTMKSDAWEKSGISQNYRYQKGRT